MNGTSRARRIAFILLAGASPVVLASPGIAQEAQSAASNSGEPEAQPAETEIIVTGIRASIEDANDAKRRSDVIKDVISAEDIGKLPDTNVAESLQRVTGVQINRDLGEGSEIAVRGFAQNRIELNGQSQLGSNAQGSVAFNSIPSEAFKSIEVIKTASADQIEGSLGATVRFNTRQPLDRNGRLVLSANLKAQYADLTDKWTPNISLLASKGWDIGDGGQIGLLVNYTHNKRKLRQDLFDVRGWEAANVPTTGVWAPGLDLDKDGVFGELIQRDAFGNISNLQDGVYIPFQTRVRVIEQDRTLDSWTGAFQYRPSSKVEVYANGTYSRNRAADRQYQLTANFSNIVSTSPVTGVSLGNVYNTPSSMVISPDRTVLSAFLGRTAGNTVNGVPFNISASSNPPQQDVWNGQLGVKWTISDRVKVDVQGTLGRGTQYNRFINSTSGLTNAERPFFFFDFGTGSDIATFVPLQSKVNGVPVTGYSPDARYDFDRIGIYQLANITVQRERQRTTEKSLRIDFDWDIDGNWLKSFEFGGRWVETKASRYRDTARDASVAGDGTLAPNTFVTLSTMEPGLITGLPFNNVLNGATGDYPRSWYLLDPQFLDQNLDDLLTKYGVVYADDLSFGFNGQTNDYAAYVKANYNFDLGDMPVYGNFGVRYVKSNRDTTGSRVSGTSSLPIVTVERVKYSDDDFLPSFSLVAEPAKKTYVRFGLAQVIARPTLFDASPLLTNSPSFDRARAGNPLLRPQKVVQADISLEKYYGKGNLLAVALFYKRFKERIEDQVINGCLPADANPGTDTTPGNDSCPVGQDLTRIAQPVNVGGATVKGFEVNLQQSFDFLPSPLDGFGVIANYTYVDAGNGSVSATGIRLPVQDLSKHSYNIIGYYEKYGITARAAYNWRSSFYDERTDTNQASFAVPYGQLDVSLSYDISRNISVGVEALNLLNRPEQRYQEIRERFLSYRVNDRRFLFGIRLKN